MQQPTALLFDLGIKQKILQVACGGSHTLILNQENDVYAFGNNNSGQLGLAPGVNDVSHIPKCLFFFQEKVVTWVSAGSEHSAALTVEGYLYSWGSNAEGQLAKASKGGLTAPAIVEQQLGRGLNYLALKYD